MSEPTRSDAFIADAFEKFGKLAYCEARIKRVVKYLEHNPNPDHKFAADLLRGALQEIAREWQ